METNLILKFLTDSISESELKALKDWIEKDYKNQELFQSYVKDYLGLNLLIQNPNLDDAYNEMWEKIQALGDRSITPQRVSYRRLWRYAAVFVGVIFLGLGTYMIHEEENQDSVPDTGTSITLTLDDGTIEVLDENTTQVINEVSGKTVASQQKNVLFYGDSIRSGSEMEELEFNELYVPFGKKFEIALSDGTHVFLNSGSKLKYPTKFLAQGPREVFLDGEAFFAVSKNERHPFRVVAEEMTTVVTGTKFNVSSYSNENNTATVLVEGSVYVEGKGLDMATDLMPGQRATFDSRKISVDEVNIEKHIAWINNQLYFEDDPFEVIIKELERHYDVTIQSELTELNKTLFTGTFETETLSQILNTFQKHTPFSYEQTEDVITIK